MQPIIRVDHLCKSFKNLDAVKDLCFSVYPGDVFGFLGQNGAGKSTTIRMLLTLIHPTSGSIELFGDNLRNKRKDLLKRVGAIIERPDLYKYMSALDNLKIFSSLSGIKQSETQLTEQLAVVGLADRKNSKVSTFSQGMKQRLGIAVALVHNPELVILDEPTNGLDPQGIAEMRSLIMQLSKEMGKTVLVSSHLLSEIEIIANRMLILHKGEKVVEGDVHVLLDPSKTTVRLGTTDNQLAFQFIRESYLNANAKIVDDILHLEMSKNDINALLIFLMEKGIGIHLVQPRHSLEEYFLNLTNHSNHAAPFAN